MVPPYKEDNEKGDRRLLASAKTIQKNTKRNLRHAGESKASKKKAVKKVK